jgi:hypothetical protein
MKVIYDYLPYGSGDGIVITSSTEDTVFTSQNLKLIDPVRCWKSSSVDSEEWIKFYGGISIDSLFINRFNFSEFTIQGNDTDVWTDPSYSFEVSGLTTDEIYDEQYMHYFHSFEEEFNYSYLRIVIPAQTPVFEETYFKIGNILIGNCVDIWNPKPGYQVDILHKNNVVEFDSGNSSEAKIGRTRRRFAGQIDKIEKSEYDKFQFSRTPMVLYNDWEDDPTKCYLVKPVGNFQRSYDYAKITTHPFEFVEIV